MKKCEMDKTEVVSILFQLLQRARSSLLKSNTFPENPHLNFYVCNSLLLEPAPAAVPPSSSSPLTQLESPTAVTSSSSSNNNNNNNHHLANGTDHNNNPNNNNNNNKEEEEEDIDSSIIPRRYRYPQQPYYKEVASMLHKWMIAEQFPIQFDKHFGEIDEDKDHEKYLHSLTPDMIDAKNKWINVTASANNNNNNNSSTDETKLNIMNDLLLKLGTRGILTLLRMRKTMGSVELFPPSNEELIAAFNEPHFGKLSVGARALSKHLHRSTTDAWWGKSLKGGDAAKSAQAQMIIQRIIDNAVWQNAHMLPHDIPCFEIRCDEGYGARWAYNKDYLNTIQTSIIVQEDDDVDTSCSSSSSSNSNSNNNNNNNNQQQKQQTAIFRGFIEPPMIDGHAKGWRH